MATTRRELVGTAGAVAAWAAMPGWARARQPLIRGGRFSQGVAAGWPLPDGALLWTRVDHIQHSGRLTLEIARDRDFKRVVERRELHARRRRDFTATARVKSAKRYPAGEEFFYRFYTRNHSSPVGRFTTRRPADSKEPVRVAFFSCQNWRTGYYTAHDGLAGEKDLDLVVCVGDYIYEAASDPGPREDKIGPDQSAQTLEEYRAKYRLYRSDQSLQAMHAAHPFAICWDDHEVMSSYYDEVPGNNQGREFRVPFPKRRRNAYRAFFENMPLPRFPHERDRIFRRIPLGATADLFLTDLHQYASPPPDCGPSPFYGPILLGPCPEAKDPSRTLLGARQRAWFEEALAASRANWRLWGTSMMLMALDSAPGQPFTIGEWSGWEGERNDLAASLHQRGISDLACFSGDIHTFFAGQWTTTGREDGEPVGVEFVSGSITSSGIADSFGGNPAAPDNVTALNPHIAYADTLRRGYAVAEAREDELRVSFRSPRSVKERPSPVTTSASFRTPRGSATVEQMSHR